MSAEYKGEERRADHLSVITTVAEHAVEIKSIKDDVRNINTSIKSLSEEVKDGFKGIGDSRQTSWSTLAAWAAVVVSVVALMGSSYVRDLSRVEESLNKLGQLHVDHVSGTGHPSINEKMRNLETNLDNLDILLQRQIRILDTTRDANIRELGNIIKEDVRVILRDNDEKLRREVKDLLQPIEKEVDLLRGVSR